MQSPTSFPNSPPNPQVHHSQAPLPILPSSKPVKQYQFAVMAPPPATNDNVEVSTTDYVQVMTPKSTARVPNDFKMGPEIDSGEADDQVPETNELIETVALSQLYRYATPMDKALLGLEVVMAGVGGALFPCMALVFGSAIDSFAQADGGVDRDAVNSAALDFFFISIALFVTDYSSGVLFAYTAEPQMKELRTEVLRHLLYLDISWYDKIDPLHLSSRLTGDTIKVKDGMGQKLCDSVRFTCQFFTGYIIGFVRGWDITLVMSCLMPFMVGSMGVLLKIMQKRAVHAQQMYAEAGAVAEETLGSIRTVSSLNAEKRAITKYNDRALAAETTNIQVGKLSAITFGFFIGCVWLMYAVGLWYGGAKVARAETTPSDVFQAFFGVLLGTMSLGQIKPNISAIAEAKGAAAQIYNILDTPSAIGASQEDTGDKPESCAGRIQAVNVNFTYPSRPDVQILNNYNVSIEPGQTVAFVGASGGGKSTLIALLERFYDPSSGSILLDGRDIKTLNVKWLRSQIGLVSQEPVLFATTIFENIAAGGDGITREQVTEAAKLANAHTFIMSLPEQFWCWMKRRAHWMRRANAWCRLR
ncbi:unnamed protein product [Phytophthora fragariaefolia]|uniref:Unnamed protein product n=1 Tax=Phytophthora fragariaefolia TaxID=1490495 RepID=A0A9W7DA10_9STRA|nr:unnamed protein product [Phytophthora fragariaefolia]